MDTIEKKYRIIEKLLKVEEPKLLDKIEALIENEVEINPILLKVLEKSNQQIENGEYFSHEEVMKRVKEKYSFWNNQRNPEELEKYL